MRMRQRECEICGASAGGISSVDLGSRIVSLCAVHARDARLAHVASPEALRALFTETGALKGAKSEISQIRLSLHMDK